MNDIKVSLICTIKNEESTIKALLDTLFSQSRPPDEIVIVDGGSSDRTVKIIKSYIKNHTLTLIVKSGANIAEGRNLAIENAKYDIIVSTDAGCTLDKRWLEKLIKPFEENQNVDVVAGVTKQFGISIFEKCIAEFTGGNVDPWPTDNFMPQSNNIGFKKDAWEKVGRYPEHLDYAEDMSFDLNLNTVGCKFNLAKDAIVYWRTRKNLRSLFKQCYNYAKWDNISGVYGYTNRYRSIAKYAIIIIILGIIFYNNLYYGLSTVVIFLTYFILRYGVSLSIKFRNIKCLYYGPIIVLTFVLTNILGIIIGIYNKVMKK